ncbi:DUF3515 family protein [Salinibacterium hongtaonis]|nr:DUF3515 family protein [Salinibacterium hongtaonis]
MPLTSQRTLAAALTATAIALLTGCAGVVPMTAAPYATSVDCAEITVRLPDAINDLKLRETDAQATAAWGDPTAVLLRCGVEVPGPSTLPCFTVKGIDWLRDDADAPTFVFTTYGRDPAVEVVIDAEATSGTSALLAIANAVGSIPATGACTSPEDVLELPEG